MLNWARYRRSLAAAAIIAVGCGTAGVQALPSFAADVSPVASVHVTSSKSVLPNGGVLKAEDSLTSPNGAYTLVLQSDSNLVIYNADKEALWASNTVGKDAATLKMQDDGNLVMYTKDESPVWDTRTDVRGVSGKKTFLRLTNSGVASVWRSGRSVWSTGDVKDLGNILKTGESLKPGQELLSENGEYRMVHQKDGNCVIYSDADKPLWDTRTDGKATKSLDLQRDGNFVLYSTDDKPLWETRTDIAGNRGRTTTAVMSDTGVLQLMRGRRVIWSSKASADPTPERPTPPRPGGAAGTVVDFVTEQIGKPYRAGAKGPRYWGNPELVVAAWGKAGYRLPSSASDIFQKLRNKHVKWAERRDGDILCYQLANTREVRCGIYVGRDEMIESIPARRGGSVTRHAIQRKLFGSTLVRPNK